MRSGKLAKESDGNTIADREIIKAINDCMKFVKEWLDDGVSLVELYAFVKNKLSFIYHEIDDEKLVYTVFEVLNSRGMEVSWLDRLKSVLMGKAFELENIDNDRLIEDLHGFWKKIYGQIGLHQGLSTEALRFTATLYCTTHLNKPLSERDSVDELRSQATNAKSIRRVARNLLNVTIALDELISNQRLNAVTSIAQARLLAVAAQLGFSQNKKELDRIIPAWERVTFRIYGMFDLDARSEVGNYVRLARRIISDSLSVSEVVKEIERIGEDYPIDDAIEELRMSDCYYNWTEQLRYFMMRYEEWLSDEQGAKIDNEQWKRIWEGNAVDSIEHIFPQSKTESEFKHFLGNLIILPLGLNKSLQDDSFSDKKQSYLDTGLLLAQEVAANERWNKTRILKREEKLLEWARKEWAD